MSVRNFVVLLGTAIALASCSGRIAVHDFSAAMAASVGPSPPLSGTFGARGDDALRTLEQALYAPPGRWVACLPNQCGFLVRDWGADALTYTLYLRWRVAHDATIPPILAALSATLPSYTPCRLGACTEWSDVPMWDAVAAEREYEVTGDAGALAKARSAFASVDRSDAYTRGACASISYQKPGGGKSALKTLETDSNYIKAALLLFMATRDPQYLTKAIARYKAVRRYFLDPHVALYSVYVFDDGRSCKQLPHRFFASVNGNMIYNGWELATLTRQHAYLDEAVATAHAVSVYLNDAAGIYADLQAENDVGEPLVEAMYDLALGYKGAVARSWLLVNGAAAIPTPGRGYGRFFAGPAPAGPVSAWSVNGGLALAIAAGALDRTGTTARPFWQHARFVTTSISTAPAAIVFTGRAIALIGTIGDVCCEAGHVRVFIDGVETFDNTGIWQNKSAAGRALAPSALLVWRWPTPGRHAIVLEPGVSNAKEGGSYIRLQGYELVP